MRPVRGLCEAGKTVRKTEPRRFLDWQRRWPNNGEVSVVDDIKLALLGNKEAAKRLTDAGVLLPCAHCGGEAKFKRGFPSRQIAHCRQAVVQCKKCGVRTVTHRQLPMERWQDVDRAAIEEWNIRAPILSAEEMLEGME